MSLFVLCHIVIVECEGDLLSSLAWWRLCLEIRAVLLLKDFLMEINFILLLQVVSFKNAGSVELLSVNRNEVLIRPLLFEYLLPVLLVVKLVVEWVEVSLQANGAVTRAPLGDSDKPERLPDHFLLLIVLFVVYGKLRIVTLEELIVDFFLSILLSFQELVLEFLHFQFFLFLFDLLFGLSPELEASKVLLHLLLESEGRV